MTMSIPSLSVGLAVAACGTAMSTELFMIGAATMNTISSTIVTSTSDVTLMSGIGR